MPACWQSYTAGCSAQDFCRIEATSWQSLQGCIIHLRLPVIESSTEVPVRLQIMVPENEAEAAEGDGLEVEEDAAEADARRKAAAKAAEEAELKKRSQVPRLFLKCSM